MCENAEAPKLKLLKWDLDTAVLLNPGALPREPLIDDPPPCVLAIFEAARLAEMADPDDAEGP